MLQFCNLFLDISEHINKLLLAPIVVLTLYATQVFIFLGACILFGSCSEKRLAVLEFLSVE